MTWAILYKLRYGANKKENEIIYVGRLDNTQKRVYRILETWNLLESKFPEWRLTFVGDGEEREAMQHLGNQMGLKRIQFEGFQTPRKYYERASILILTSEFEGFPLVIAECMSFGIVPVVVLVDDIVDTAGTIVKAANLIKENGAASVRAIASHCILSGPASERVMASALDEIIFTDSIPFRGNCPKLRQLSASKIYAETIRRVFENKPISDMYLV